MDEKLLDRASEVAFARLLKVGGDWQKLEEPLRILVTIYSAQGVIDNGGLRYFFENDWPGNPPYSTFSDAYGAVGAVAEAKVLRQAVDLFSFPHPEQEGRRRRELLSGKVGKLVDELDTQIVSDVWKFLESYVRNNKTAFLGGP